MPPRFAILAVATLTYRVTIAASRKRRRRTPVDVVDPAASKLHAEAGAGALEVPT
jgi:hypothetical protein